MIEAGSDDLVQVGVALLIIDRVFSFVKAMIGKSNGHASVRPQDAPEFFLLQREIKEDTKKILSEVSDPDVRRHHRS